MKIRRILKWGSIGLGTLVAVGGLSAALWWYRPWMPAPAYTPVSELQAAMENVRTSTTLFPQPRDASVWPAWEAAVNRADELRTASRQRDPVTDEISETKGEVSIITLRNIDPTNVPDAREQLSSPEVVALLAEFDRLADGPAPVPPGRNEPIDLMTRLLPSEVWRTASAAAHYLGGRLGLAGIDRDRAAAVRAFRSLDRFHRIWALSVSSLDLVKITSAWAGTRREMQMQMLESPWTETELAELDRACREGMPDHAGWIAMTSAVQGVIRLQFMSGNHTNGAPILLSDRSGRAFARQWADELSGLTTDLAAKIEPPAPQDLGGPDLSRDVMSKWLSGSKVTPAVYAAMESSSSRRLGVSLRRTYLSGLGTRVMVAVKRHQLRTGALPASLAEIPADLWSGSVPPLEAYEYRVNPDGTFHLAVLGPGKPELRILTMPRAEYMKPRPSPLDSD